VTKKRARRKLKNNTSNNLTLNAAISIVGVLLLGFIYSFSQNTTHSGTPIQVTFPEIENHHRLAVDVYEDNPIQNIRVEVLNGCGIKGLANKASNFLRLHQVDVIRAENADRYDYPNTIIIGRNENYESLKMVTQSFGISIDNKDHIKIEPDESLGVDVTVILGKDINSFTDIFDFISSSQ
jgi:hypothetical protein